MKLFKMEGIPNPFARAYSALVSRTSFTRDFYQQVADEVSARAKPGRILDIGTGPGYVPLEIARRRQDLEIKAIDISSAMVRIAARNAGLSGRVQFLHGTAESMPFEDGYFDLVISTISLHHWAEPKKCLKEINRVLKDGGEAWVYDLRRDVSDTAKAQLKQKHGLFLAFMVLYFVRLHSSISSKRIDELISGIGFSKKTVEERGIILKLTLLK